MEDVFLSWIFIAGVAYIFQEIPKLIRLAKT